MNRLRKWYDRIFRMSFRQKMITLFVVFAAVILVVNTLNSQLINHLMEQLEEVYVSNLELTKLDNTVSMLELKVEDYVQTRSSDSMEEYYRYEQELREQTRNLNRKAVDNEMLLTEKNIAMLCDSYLDLASETIQAKRARNIELYSSLSEDLKLLEKQIHAYVNSLNNEQFVENSNYYMALNHVLRNTQRLGVVALIIALIGSLTLISFSSAVMVRPLNRLAESANEVAKGNFAFEALPIQSDDEVGVVTKAFNQMVESINLYIEELRETLERENKLKERELMMQSHLKDAQLKYLQAQINPHFLFNTINAGAQLAMMEDATKTGELLDHTASFFRYIVKNKEDASICEEVQLVDNYIYICNVRFAGEILFEKDVDESLEDIKMPSMILQPLVENAFNYGIRNIGREGRIELSVYEKNGRVYLSVWDNGNGMTAERIDEVLHAETPTPDARSKSSNGVGIRNLKERLSLYYKGQATFDIISEGSNLGTEILISFPVDWEE